MPDTSDSVLASRRKLLAGAGAAGVLAAGAVTGLAGCGTSSGNGSGSDMGSGSGTGASAAPPASMAPGEGGGANTTSVNLGKSSHIPVGSGKIFKTEKVVVTQPKAGHFKAFTAICTHQQCTVSSIAKGIIHCPCHGSQFSIEDGSVKGGPAPAPLAEKEVTVKNGNIVVT